MVERLRTGVHLSQAPVIHGQYVKLATRL